LENHDPQGGFEKIVGSASGGEIRDGWVKSDLGGIELALPARQRNYHHD
jgi:hypothetical protein